MSGRLATAKSHKPLPKWQQVIKSVLVYFLGFQIYTQRDNISCHVDIPWYTIANTKSRLHFGSFIVLRLHSILTDKHKLQKKKKEEVKGNDDKKKGERESNTCFV